MFTIYKTSDINKTACIDERFPFGTATLQVAKTIGRKEEAHA